MTVHIKRAYEAASPEDGFRVLVDRLWPRGVSKTTLHYDLWARDVAPSDALRRWYHIAPQERWLEFRCKYTDELQHSQASHAFIRAVSHEHTVTLLFASKNVAENNALVLRDFLQRALTGVSAGCVR